VAFADWLRPLADKPRVVYSKPPFAGPDIVLKYLMKARVQLTIVAQFLAPTLAVRAAASKTWIETAPGATGHTAGRQQQAPARIRGSEAGALPLFGACEGTSVTIESSGNA